MNANPTPNADRPSSIAQSFAAQPSAAQPSMGLLPHLGVLRFAGTDAVSFLQGQLSNDTRRLASGSTLLAAYSTPQGRVVALLHLLPHSSGTLAFLPREIVLPTLERLRKFVMRAKVRVEDVSDQLSVAGCHGAEALRAVGLAPPPADPAAPNPYVEHDGIGVAPVAGAGAPSEAAQGEVLAGASASASEVGSSNRYWIVGSAADLEARGIGTVGTDSSGVDNAWRLADIRAGVPQVYAATREMFVAQMLNLDLIDGISFTKGCFTGQEIIARTQHLGRIKRRLFRLRLPAGTWAIGQAVHLLDGRSGRLTELAQAATGIEALAVLTLDPDTAAEAGSDPGTRVDADELALPYALVQKT